MNCGIYEIKCSVNGKVYIGSSVDLKHRWMDHRGYLRTNVHHNPHLQRAWNKYGEDAFEFVIIKYCEPDQTLIEEQKALDEAFGKVGQVGLFNIAKDALAPMKGRPITSETRAKISATMKGRPGRKHSQEVLERISKTKRSTYTGFISPDGTEHEPIENLKQFCKENKLDYSRMHSIAKGKRHSYKGWTHKNCKKLEWGKIYNGLVNPNGILHNSIKNLSDFCRQNNLRRSLIQQVIAGTRNHHKGWTYNSNEDKDLWQ